MTNSDNRCIIAECREAMHAGRTLDDPAGLLHVDTEYHGRLLQLPEASAVQPVAADDGPDLWRIGELHCVL